LTFIGWISPRFIRCVKRLAKVGLYFEPLVGQNGCGRGGTTHDPKVAEKLIPTTYAARTGAGTVSATA
jgi:hypothetical protein